MNFNEINNRISKSQSVEFGSIFDQSIKLFKKTWVQGFLMMLLNIALIFVLEMAIFIPVMMFAGASTMFDPNFVKGLSVIAIVVLLLLFILIICAATTVSNGLLGGLYLIYKKADENDHYSVGDFFILLKKETIFRTFKVAVAKIAVILISYAMCCVGLLYTFVPIYFITIMHAYNPELKTIEVVKSAFNLGNKNWLVTCGLIIVTFLMSYIGGLLLCLIGFLFTFAFFLIPAYFIYKEAIGFEDESEINSIGIEEGF